ncbi:protein sel-1 homolog 3 isoform X1 [Alosa sapidissima]|uniref:protein sel-1 homolog 3 isoform X1 n=1 Tax=Alosa sapidissima TaxID=34773 RepID=UPI001C0990D6|nr:protein sel-1 homolog 3 isoform X1 [Alosa sapidissima]
MKGFKWNSSLLRLVVQHVVFFLTQFTVSECADHHHTFDDVIFLNQIEEVESSSLQVLYSCSEPSVVHVEALASFDTGDTSTIFRRHWTCHPGSSKVRTVALTLPDWLVYQADWKIQPSAWVLTAMLRAWVSGAGSLDDYMSAPARAMTLLNLREPFSRPMKQHQLCLSWGLEMKWGALKDKIPQCPQEQEVAVFLSTLYASTGEKFGIVRTIQPFSDEVLESLRLKAIPYPWCAFSIWIYLLHPCRQQLCGVLHHLDSKRTYASPSLFLKNSGHLHIQMHGAPGVSSAFLSAFTVPIRQWCHLNVVLDGWMVRITMTCRDGQHYIVHSSNHVFDIAFHLDDTDGYFAVGGGEFVNGIEGYYGPIIYYRNRMLPQTESEGHIPPSITLMTEWYQSCHKFEFDVRMKIAQYLQRVRENGHSDVCVDAYNQWQSKDRFHIKAPQCEAWEAPSLPQRRHVFLIAEKLANKYGPLVRPVTIGKALYSLTLHKLTQAMDTRVISRMMPLLLQAGCLGDKRALYLSSVLYSSSAGVKPRPERAWLLALLAAQQDWRLALLRLGHLHHLGDQNVPPDPDLAYAYYANIAKQTSADRQNFTSQQTFVEAIYLNNEEVLKAQTNENHDLFHWLKLQARNGVAGAEQAMGRMLFWGQQGVSSDIQTAVRHYQRGALRLEDPVSMYDYAIVLLTGRGVERDIPKAVMFLKKALERGFVPAMNALGWYYEQHEKDYGRAVQLWEQADALGSPDAAMNLGVMHSQGFYPGKPADQVMAYHYFLKSAQRGHVDGAITLAEVWNKGIPNHMSRLPNHAVLWAKWASEQNGYLGRVLRKGLDAYFKEKWLMALIHYLMAAESGFASAQFNVAYLCEQNPGGFLTQAFVKQCMLRYYNLTIQSEYPDRYALIKMGDLLSVSNMTDKKDVTKAAEMYKLATLSGEPQGWYSLGMLVQEGETLPVSLLVELNLLLPYLTDKQDLLTTLYRRCIDSNATDAYIPCSLALFNVYLHSFWETNIVLKTSSTVAITAATVAMAFVISNIIRRYVMDTGQIT